MSTTPSRPEGLQPAGRALWNEVQTLLAGQEPAMVLDPDEHAVLGQACVTADELERLRDELAGQPVTVPGSKGQPVAHPLLAEVRAHRETLRRLLSGLRIPPDQEQESNRTVSQRTKAASHAARSRWGSHGQSA